jgi:hypothetical protein
MNPSPLVRANSILPIIKFLEQVGIPTERLIREAKLPISILDDPEALISLYHGFTIIEKVAHLTISPPSFFTSSCVNLSLLGLLAGLSPRQHTRFGRTSIINPVSCLTHDALRAPRSYRV